MDKSQADLEARYREKAERFFGYGSWMAPYWFLGQEEGQPPGTIPVLTPRVQAWLDLGQTELCDCHEFHQRIGEGDLFSDKPRFVLTWKYLIMSLLAFLRDSQQPVSLEDIYAYQRSRWGRIDGDACAIELSGVPAKDLKAGAALAAELFDAQMLTELREKRIKTICKKIEEYKPKFVVMYGVRDKKQWERIAGRPLSPGNVAKAGSTWFVMMKAPAARGTTNTHWEELGHNLRVAIRQ